MDGNILYQSHAPGRAAQAHPCLAASFRSRRDEGVEGAGAEGDKMISEYSEINGGPSGRPQAYWGHERQPSARHAGRGPGPVHRGLGTDGRSVGDHADDGGGARAAVRDGRAAVHGRRDGPPADLAWERFDVAAGVAGLGRGVADAQARRPEGVLRRGTGRVDDVPGDRARADQARGGPAAGVDARDPRCSGSYGWL